MIYDRKENKYYEYKESKILLFLYKNKIGNIFLKMINTKSFSNLASKYMSSRLSKYKINKTITNNNINMNDYIKADYKCFNDFFSRRIKKESRPIPKDKKLLLSPCDSKLSIYKINKDTIVNIKKIDYTIESLLKDKDIASKYNEGVCLVFRLGVEDYHYYHFIDDGIVVMNKKIKGIYDSVRPIVLETKEVFKENNREWSLLKTSNFDEVIYMEVGALAVGKIVNNDITKFKRGDEKGHFKFGGSTIVLLFKKDIINIDKDILKETKKGNEVKVQLFESIGSKK